MDIHILFKDYAGDDVEFLSHRRIGRTVEITYRIPRVDYRERKIKATPSNGLYPSLRRAVLKAAERARVQAYMLTGDMKREFDNLTQGKLADGTQRPRGVKETAEVGAAAAVDPEP
jgi:hypothetical protein